MVAYGNTGTTDMIFYRVDGYSPTRVLTIEYRSVSLYSEANNTYLYGQIKLYEAQNKIEVIYDNSLNDWIGINRNVSCSIGIENTTGSTGYSGTSSSPNISGLSGYNYRFQ